MKGEPCKLLEIVWIPVPRRGKRSLGVEDCHMFGVDYLSCQDQLEKGLD